MKEELNHREVLNHLLNGEIIIDSDKWLYRMQDDEMQMRIPNSMGWTSGSFATGSDTYFLYTPEPEEKALETVNIHNYFYTLEDQTTLKSTGWTEGDFINEIGPYELHLVHTETRTIEVKR